MTEPEFKAFSGVEDLPRGRASKVITPGCVCLEGGAFRGVYTSGVLDALMEADINFQCTVGVSAGALNGINYVAGQIGRSARINLKYRHDPEYIGPKAYKANKGIIGFDFVLKRVNRFDPFDFKTFNRPERRFIAVAAGCADGKAAYFEKGICKEIYQAVRASASMPFVSKPVMVEGKYYLDGGCAAKIPYKWAIEQGFEKIVVIKTRPAGYVPKPDEINRLAPTIYRNHPKFARSLYYSDRAYTRELTQLELLRRKKRVFIIEPSKKINVSRLEPDMEKLGELYYLGYEDGKRLIPELLEYLEN